MSGKISVAQGTDVLNWSWPQAASSFTVYDKNTEIHTSLEIAQADWTFTIGGVKRTVYFASGAHGKIQRNLSVLAQNGKGPSSLYRFGVTLVKGWETFPF